MHLAQLLENSDDDFMRHPPSFNKEHDNGRWTLIGITIIARSSGLEKVTNIIGHQRMHSPRIIHSFTAGKIYEIACGPWSTIPLARFSLKQHLMSRPNLLSSIVHNNNGASMMEQGDCIRALPRLAAALRSAKQYMLEASLGGLQMLVFNVDDLISISAPRNCCRDEGFVVFDQPIRIPEPMFYKDEQDIHCSEDYDDASTRRVVTSAVMCSAVSMLNLGMAYHLQGIEKPAQNLAFLKKAGKLYELVLKLLLQEAPCFAQSNPCGDGVVFSLMVLNNLIDVHQRLGDIKSTEQYCEEVLHMLMHVSCSERASTDVLDVFNRNLYFYLLSSRGVNVAPSA